MGTAAFAYTLIVSKRKGDFDENDRENDTLCLVGGGVYGECGGADVVV